LSVSYYVDLELKNGFDNQVISSANVTVFNGTNSTELTKLSDRTPAPKPTAVFGFCNPQVLESYSCVFL